MLSSSPPEDQVETARCPRPVRQFARMRPAGVHRSVLTVARIPKPRVALTVLRRLQEGDAALAHVGVGLRERLRRLVGFAVVLRPVEERELPERVRVGGEENFAVRRLDACRRADLAAEVLLRLVGDYSKFLPGFTVVVAPDLAVGAVMRLGFDVRGLIQLDVQQDRVLPARQLDLHRVLKQ